MSRVHRANGSSVRDLCLGVCTPRRRRWVRIEPSALQGRSYDQQGGSDAVMTNATASPKVDRTIRLRDELRMAYCEWGDLDGRPVVLLTFPDAGHLFPISHWAEMLAALH